MEMVKQMVYILLFLYIGYVIEHTLNIPIPPNVMGMILLIIALITGILKLKKIEQIVNFIIKYLPVFYIVPSVGLMMHFELLKNDFIIIIVPVFISIITGFFVAGKTTELLIRRGTSKND